MQVDGQLKSAQLELLASASPLPAPLGRQYMDTTGGTKAVMRVRDLNRWSKLLTDNTSNAAKTATYLLTLDDEVVFFNAAGGSLVANLPPAADAAGKKFVLVRTDTVIANDVTVTPNAAGETVDGSTTFILKTKNDSITLLSNGLIWLLLSHTYDEGWVTAVPSGANWAANTAVTFMYKRKGKSISGQWNFALSGAPDVATLLLYLPTGFLIDTTAMVQTTANKQLFPGNVMIYDTSATERYHGWAAYNDTSSLTVYKDDGDGTLSVVNATNPMTFATGDSVTAMITEIPIVKLR